MKQLRTRYQRSIEGMMKRREQGNYKIPTNSVTKFIMLLCTDVGQIAWREAGMVNSSLFEQTRGQAQVNGSCETDLPPVSSQPTPSLHQNELQ